MPADVDPEVALRELLGRIAPGTALRDGLERILAGRTGALIVLGYDRVVESLCTGGFALDVALSATRLRELAKMDGAVIVSYDGTRIVRAGVHLMPDPTIPTEESGTRHRTAERVAIQTGFPVISVSQSMHIISVYVAGRRYTLEHPTTILARANQALAALERYKLRLDEVASTLSALEIEDLVTVRDAMSVSQRLEMVRRIADEIEGFVVELGTDGRLLALQLDEMLAGVEEDRGLLVRDYLPGGGRRPRTIDQVLTDLRALTATELLDLSAVARCYGLPTSPTPWTPPSALAATGCSTACRGCRRGSSTGWWTTSAACRSCWPRPSRTCWPSRASARPGPAGSARGCRASRRPRSSTATAERPSSGEDERHVRRDLGVQAPAHHVIAGGRRGPCRRAGRLAGQSSPHERDRHDLTRCQRARIAARLREAVVAPPDPVAGRSNSAAPAGPCPARAHRAPPRRWRPAVRRWACSRRRRCPGCAPRARSCRRCTGHPRRDRARRARPRRRRRRGTRGGVGVATALSEGTTRSSAGTGRVARGRRGAAGAVPGGHRLNASQAPPPRTATTRVSRTSRRRQ